MATAESGDEAARLPLSEVVSDCVERWFQDSLKDAKAGDVNMQVLVGQMYNCGYGIPKDADKVSLSLSHDNSIFFKVLGVCRCLFPELDI